MTSLNWLHFTDLHHGIGAQDTLWPNLQNIFLEDLERIHEVCGPWDLVLFTGDLTQQGTAKEFNSLNDTLDLITDRLHELGSNPLLLAVPGNHDLVRPYPDDPRLMEIKKIDPSQEDLHSLLTTPTGDVRKLIDDAFTNYVKWWRGRVELYRKQPIHFGLLPGEFSTIIGRGDINFGVVGLNTAAFQLADGNYEGKLLLSPTQFNQACGGNGPEWANQCDFLLLITHHPPAWLQKASHDALLSEIAPPGRFVAHLFGHMHEPAQTTMAIGGARPWRFWQGCSLFGLQHVKRRIMRVDRQHGYAAGRLQLNDEGAQIRQWPRKAVRHQAGYWKIARDESFTLEQDAGTPAEPVGSPRRIRRTRDSTEQFLVDLQRRALKGWRLFDFQRDIRIDKVYVKEILQQAASRSVLDPMRTPFGSAPFNEAWVYNLAVGLSSDADNPGILIVRGRAGSGKSTMLRKWTLNVMEERELDHSLPMPIFLTLRHLGRDSVSSLLTNADLGRCLALTIAGVDERTAATIFLNLAKNGEATSASPKWLLICDGLDELHARMRVPFVGWVRSISKHVRVVVSSRPKVIEDLGHIPGSKEYELCDFNDKQIESFIEQWFSGNPVLAEQLRTEIAKNQALGGLAKIPLLLTCLSMHVEVTGDANFPREIRESAIIRSIIEILLDRWDATKLGRAVSYHRIELGMRALSDLAGEIDYEGEFDYLHLLSLVEKHSIALGVSAVESQEFLDDLLTSGRLLMGGRDRGFAFTHAVFFDFFFAELLRRRRSQPEITP